MKRRSLAGAGIVVLAGAPGFGKSTGVAIAARMYDGVFARAWPTSTPCSITGSIVRELGAQPFGRVQPALDFIIAEERASRRPVFVDECDPLSAKLLDILRGISDEAGITLILIGTDGFAQAPKHRKQIASRVTEWVDFRPLGEPDARAIAAARCEVALDDALLMRLHQASAGSVRTFVQSLTRVEAFARQCGAERIGDDDWSAHLMARRPNVAAMRPGLAA